MSSSKIDAAAIPKLIKEMDLQDTSLSGEEGFLLSRIDGRSKVADLCKVTGFEESKTHQLLSTLVHKGYLKIDGCQVKDEALDCQEEIPAEDQGKPWAGMKFNPFDLNEEVDLSLDLRKRILYMFSKKDSLTHYQMLDLPRRTEAKDIKRAYFRVSKDFHPDSYFRKNLGGYKSKIESLFKRVSLAYEVLSDVRKREVYDKTLPYEPTPEELAQQEKKKQTQAKDERLRDERRRRLLRRMPMTLRKAQASRHYEAAKEAREAKNFSRATNAIRLALTLDPDNETYKKMEEEVSPQASVLRAEREFKRGRYEEEMGNDEVALRAYETAVECSEKDVRSLYRAARLMLKLDRDLRKALSLCRRALEIEPDNTEALEAMGDIYDAMGMHKNSLREYGRLIQLKPLDDKVQKKIEILKKKTK